MGRQNTLKRLSENRGPFLYNRKTVTVLTEGGQRWNVSPHLLSPVKDAGSNAQPKTPQNKKRLK
jgi:hypothetical protein